MFNFFKRNKDSLPDGIKLIITSEEDYKELLKSKIALRLLSDSLAPDCNNRSYTIQEYEMQAIGKAMEEAYNKTWTEAINECETVCNGKILILGGAEKAFRDAQ